jgi:hypothetical protein
MVTDDLEAWVECLRRRRYAELSTAVWDLLWLAAQHRSFVMKPKAGVGLEFIVGGEETRVYPLADNVGWLRAILARLAGLLKDLGAITEMTGHYGFTARIRMPDSTGADRPFEIEMKNNQRAGLFLAVRQSDLQSENGARSEVQPG